MWPFANPTCQPKDMVQTVSVGPEVSCGAEKHQKQHHGYEWLLGTCLDPRNGFTPCIY